MIIGDKKLKSNHTEHFFHKSIYNALQMSLHMTTLICKNKASEIHQEWSKASDEN